MVSPKVQYIVSGSNFQIQKKTQSILEKANQLFHEFGGIEGGVFSCSKIKMENDHFRLRSADHLLDSQQYLNKKTGDL